MNMSQAGRAVALSVALAVIACGSASAAERGLVAAYSFDEASGPTVVDGSPLGNSGRVSGARRTAAGRSGGGLRFDGAGDVVRVGHDRPLRFARALTVQAWVRPALRGGRWRDVVALGPSGRPRVALQARGRGARIVVRSRGGARTVAWRARRRVRGWTHLAATYGGGAVRVYVDGRAAGRRGLRGRVGAVRGLRVGGRRPGFAGTIDEVRVYRRALTGRQIRAGMAPGGGGGEPGPPAPGRIPVYTRENPPRTPSLDELAKVTSLSQDGVTWQFSHAVPAGRFLGGDPYVVGDVTVTAITPAPAAGRNGSVKNLPAVDDESGFDSRTYGNRYKPGLRSDPPIALRPGDSLVSSISVEEVGRTRRWLFDRATVSPVRTISVLTVMGAPQPPDAFRPSYAGRGSPVFLSRNLRRELLPRLSPVAGTPSLAEYEAHFRRPWVDSVLFNFDTPIEYMPDYAREIARAVGNAGLLLSLDLPPEQKEPLLVYLTQYGIDLAGLVRAGHPGWPAHGGHGSGRKLPIVLAGTLLGETAMQHPAAEFGEDMQTMFGQGWTGASALYAGHYGVSGTGEFGPYEHLQPSDWPGTLGEDYRRCCTSSAWIGEALVARLVPGVQTAWDHPAFFAYADRWMTEDDTQALATIDAQRGNDYSSFPQREAWDDFATRMWRAYRGG